MTEADVIDTLAGLASDSPLALIRRRKPVTREHAQASYRALFEPSDTMEVSVQERFALAWFVAALHDQEAVAAFYAAGLAQTGPADGFVAAVSAEIERGHAMGPYGTYPKGPLSGEDMAGPVYAVAQAHRAALGVRVSAALAHVHMLVFHPRDASPDSLQTLLDAGWSNSGVVTVSQLVAFLAFQIRAVAGLRTLAETAA
jgi:CMD domain protein